MKEYYVIRDKNTGLYFRGKGVNRWGKHYNQASIYRIKKNAETTIKEVSWRGERTEIVPIQIVETTADVVEVVRCKDCVYYLPLGGAHIYKGKLAMHCFWHSRFVKEDGYCGEGIRKPKEANEATQ